MYAMYIEHLNQNICNLNVDIVIKNIYDCLVVYAFIFGANICMFSSLLVWQVSRTKACNTSAKILIKCQKYHCLAVVHGKVSEIFNILISICCTFSIATVYYIHIL